MITFNQATMSSAYTATSWRTPRMPALIQPPTFQIGQFVTLAVLPLNSVLTGQYHITETACKHPLVIVGIKDDSTTVIITVLQVTSFAGQLIDEKYHDHTDTSRRRKASYLAIDHENTRRHGEHRPLKLVFDTKMDKQSYVNLDQFFTVEAEYLKPWKNGRHRLDSESISTLEKAFLNFVNGVAQRPGKTMESVDSPFDYWPRQCLTASFLGVNDTRFVRPPRDNQAVTITRPPSQSPLMPCSRKAAKGRHPAHESTNWRAPAVRAAS